MVQNRFEIAGTVWHKYDPDDQREARQIFARAALAAVHMGLSTDEMLLSIHKAKDHLREVEEGQERAWRETMTANGHDIPEVELWITRTLAQIDRSRPQEGAFRGMFRLPGSTASGQQ